MKFVMNENDVLLILSHMLGASLQDKAATDKAYDDVKVYISRLRNELTPQKKELNDLISISSKKQETKSTENDPVSQKAEENADAEAKARAFIKSTEQILADRQKTLSQYEEVLNKRIEIADFGALIHLETKELAWLVKNMRIDIS